jgi:diguanylate cyclase (GGDEF)-like protein
VCGFAASEIFVIHLHRGRQTHTFSLVEIPLVVGLYLASPLQLLTSRLVGAGITLAVHRRQSPMKLFFNMSMFAAQTVLAIVTFRFLAGDHVAIGPASWPATFAACIAANLLGAIAVSGAIAATCGEVSAATIRQLVLEGTVLGPVANTSIALCLTVLLWFEPPAAFLMASIAAIVVLAFRGYVTLRARYANLTKLYEFNTLTQRGGKDEDAVVAMLDAARTVMGTEKALLALLTPDGAFAVVVRVDGAESTSSDLVPINQLGLLWQLTSTAPSGRLLPANGGTQADCAALNEVGWRDGVSAVLRHDGEPSGLIAVGDRINTTSSFDDEDLTLFNALVSHAEVVLDNAQLVGRLQHEAMHDALTGLPNRSLFNRDIDTALRQRKVGQKIAVLLMDLDRFKDVNDTLGHHHGDQLLIEVGRRLRAASVEGSTVARLGGDEFAILLPANTNANAFHQQAVAIGDVLRSVFDVSDVQVEATASIGIAVAPDHGEDPITLLQRADIAMYASKVSGQVEIYSQEHDGNSRRRLGLATELRTAVSDGQLEVWYQPQAEARIGAVCGVEALVRWRHPERGLILPGDFISVAEQTGLIGPLTNHVVTASSRQWTIWQAAGLSIDISLNISMRNLHDPSFARQVRSHLETGGMPPSALTIEITESSIMADSARIVRTINELALTGIGISVDDFGTGYSSLTHLRQLPVREIKIDKSFVMHMTDEGSEGDRAIVRAVIDLGRNLGLSVVAEGVESAEAWRQLAEWGCHRVQGYYLAKPMPADALTDWLMDRPTPSRDRQWDRVLIEPSPQSGPT